MSTEEAKNMLLINEIKVEIINKSNNPDPAYASHGDAGMDIRAFLEEPVTILPGETKVIHTGIYVAVPYGYVCYVCSRSGLAANSNVFVLNAPGVVDSSYRGEIMVILHNAGSKEFVVNPSDRIAQLIFAPYAVTTFEKVEELDTTDRGNQGFGHTGVK